jgi:hypothetical protein
MCKFLREKMKVLICSLILFLLSNTLAAEPSGYDFCSIIGYEYGSNNDFFAGLAMRIAEKKGINVMEDPVCSAAWKNGVEIAKNISKSGKISTETENKVSSQASQFEKEVQEAIIKIMGY